MFKFFSLKLQMWFDDKLYLVLFKDIFILHPFITSKCNTFFFFFFWKRFIIKFWWNLIYFDLIWFGMFLPKWMSGEPCSFCSFFTFFILRFFIFLIFFLYVIVVILRCVFQEKLPQKSIDVRKSQSESLFHCWLFF